MLTKRFSKNGSRRSGRHNDAERDELVDTPATNGENGRRRKTRLTANGENAAVARPESSTGVKNQPRCWRSATPFASLRAFHPAASNGGNGAWTAFVVTVAPTLNGGNGGGIAFVTAGMVEEGDGGRVTYVTACGETRVLAESARDEKTKGSAPLTSCAAPLEACAAPPETLTSCAAPLAAGAAPAERDGRGRFVKGNKGGPGNPFNRRLAAMRKALCKAVSADDIRDLTALMLAKARDGDLAAMKLVFLYAIGRRARRSIRIRWTTRSGRCSSDRRCRKI